jgi:hypothetical protein
MKTYTRHVENVVFRLVLSVHYTSDLKPTVVFESTSQFGAIPNVGNRINIGDIPEFLDSGHATAIVRAVAHSFYPHGAGKLVHQINIHCDHEG